MLTLAAYVGYVRRPFSLGRYLLVAATVCAGADGQADAGYVALRVAVVGLLAAGAILGLGRRECSGRQAIQPFVDGRGIDRREIALGGDGRHFLRGDPLGPENGSRLVRSHTAVHSNCQRPGFLRRLFGAVVLSVGPGRVLSPPGGRRSQGNGYRRLSAAGRHLRSSCALAAEVPLSLRRLAVVRGHAGACDWAGASRRPVASRPLHLPNADRPVYRPGLGHVAHFQVLALSPLGLRHHVGDCGTASGSVCMAANFLLARQRDLMDS